MAGQSFARVFLLLSFLIVLVRSHAYHHHHRDHRRVRRSVEAEGLENRALRIEYEEKLQLRDLVLKTLSTSQNRVERRTAYTAIDLDEEYQELQAGLDELNGAFEALYNILAKDLPVCLTSTAVQAISVSATASTSQPVSTKYSTSDVTLGSTATSSSSLIAGTDIVVRKASSTHRSTTSTHAASKSASKSSSTSAKASSSTSSTFDPMSSSNVAVYYGQANITSKVRLDSLCKDDSVDIVVLSFITAFDYKSTGYPGLNLGGSNCSDASTAQTEAGATGLIDCTVGTDSVATQIQTCQTLGKPVLLSIGGSIASVTIASEGDAATYAEMLWNLFGEGTGESSIRPFGNVSVDGFDFDNESDDSSHYDTLITSMRSYLSTAAKPMYLSAAPQCPRPDEDIPLSSMQSSLDFIFVQFYHNPSCNVDTGTGFLKSVAAWSADINSTTASAAGETFVNIGNGVTSPRLYIGVPSFYAADPNSYTSAADLASIFEDVRALGLGNLGGGSLWNGEWGEKNKDSDGNSFVSVFKEDLEG